MHCCARTAWLRTGCRYENSSPKLQETESWCQERSPHCMLMLVMLLVCASLPACQLYTGIAV
uniref:Uncharacterized protein n=1 Tax=Mus musculus TaxID=10090 RepID=Q3V0H6_MOUSE|nr:unnamed protein product [Mus musculus]